MAVNIPVLTSQNNQTSIGILFPFQTTNSGGVIAPTTTTLQTIQSDLIALLTTPQRGRVMNNNLFSPLPGFIFEQLDEVSLNTLQTQIQNLLTTYMPDISVIAINLTPNNNILNVVIQYSVPSIGAANQSVQVGIQMGS